MILTSIAVGVLAIVVALILTSIVMVTIVFVAPSPKDGTSLGWDPVSFMKSWLAWTISAAAFLAGFAWEYRRSR